MEQYITKEMIERAQQLREELGYTYQFIEEESKNIGLPVSLSTIKRFFAPEAHTHRFATDTVQGIFAVLGDTRHDTNDVILPKQASLLKGIIAERNARIAMLERQIEKMKEESTEQTFRIVAENQKKLDYVKSTVDAFQKQIDVKDRRMDERDRFFMSQIELKDRRYDDLLEKYNALLEKVMA